MIVPKLADKTIYGNKKNHFHRKKLWTQSVSLRFFKVFSRWFAHSGVDLWAFRFWEVYHKLTVILCALFPNVVPTLLIKQVWEPVYKNPSSLNRSYKWQIQHFDPRIPNPGICCGIAQNMRTLNDSRHIF